MTTTYYFSSDRDRDRNYPYDPESPIERFRRERSRINIAHPDIDKILNSGMHPSPSCPDDPGIPLVPKTDEKTGKAAMWCRECGEYFTLEKVQPAATTTTSASKTKVKQKQTSQSKTFVQSLPTRKRKGKGALGAPDESASLSDSEYDFIRNLYGGDIVEGTDTEAI